MKLKQSVVSMLLQYKINNNKWRSHLSANPNAYTMLSENQHDIDWIYFSKNTHPIAIISLQTTIKKKLDKYNISWIHLSRNPEAVELLKLKPKKIYWLSLSQNPSPEAIDLLEKNPENIHWPSLCENPSAMRLIKANPDKIIWKRLCENPASEAVEMILANPDKIDWEALSLNSNTKVVELLILNPEKINWFNFCYNSNPLAFELFELNIKNISWFALSFNTNPRVLELFDKYEYVYMADVKSGKTNISYLLEQPYIFEYDYERMKQHMDILREDLIKEAIHPRRVKSWIDNGDEDMLE